VKPLTRENEFFGRIPASLRDGQSISGLSPPGAIRPFPADPLVQRIAPRHEGGQSVSPLKLLEFPEVFTKIASFLPREC